jgi:hypothetical protein
MRTLDSVRKEIIKADKVLVIAFILSFIFCLHGITSRVMHPDQMAFHPLFQEGKLPFNPGWFEKPPFHTYFNYFLAVLPISIVDKALHLPPDTLEFTKRVWSKLLTAFLFLGSVAIVFHITRKSFGIFSARLVTWIFATSAGLIAHSHFLTADIPVMFWMLVAFYFSQAISFERKLSNYVLAGFFTGIATATKYNGLAVGITIVIAHILSFDSMIWKPIFWKQILLSKKLFVGLLMVIIGFVVGNPFSLLDYRTFTYDFIYNYLVAPVYEGQTGHSYGKFFSAIVEIIGLPSFLIFSIAVLFSLYLTLLNKAQRISQTTILLSFSVFLLYYFKFASFPRLETRFVLPIVPWWLMMSGLFWDKLKPYKYTVLVFLIGILSYNLISSFYVGIRFLDDPRMRAEIWVKENIPQNSSIESDIYSSSWNEVSGVQLRETTTPFVTGRERLFEQLFKGNRFVVGSEEYRRKVDEKVKWYSLEELMIRSPDFVATDSLYYQRFIEPGLRRDLYPSMQEFYEALLNEQYPYEIVFDDASKAIPAWIYPRDIDFLHYRVTIFTRKKLISGN